MYIAAAAWSAYFPLKLSKCFVFVQLISICHFVVHCVHTVTVICSY